MEILDCQKKSRVEVGLAREQGCPDRLTCTRLVADDCQQAQRREWTGKSESGRILARFTFDLPGVSIGNKLTRTFPTDLHPGAEQPSAPRCACGSLCSSVSTSPARHLLIITCVFHLPINSFHAYACATMKIRLVLHLIVPPMPYFLQT